MPMQMVDTSVSYTHLDVYKRQDIDIALGPGCNILVDVISFHHDSSIQLRLTVNIYVLRRENMYAGIFIPMILLGILHFISMQKKKAQSLRIGLFSYPSILPELKPARNVDSRSWSAYIELHPTPLRDMTRPQRRGDGRKPPVPPHTCLLYTSCCSGISEKKNHSHTFC